MRRRTLILAQTRIRGAEFLAREHPDVNPNGKDIRIIPTSAKDCLDRLRGLSGFDYILLDGWDFFLTERGKAEFWNMVTIPGVDAVQLSPSSLVPLQ